MVQVNVMTIINVVCYVQVFVIRSGVHCCLSIIFLQPIQVLFPMSSSQLVPQHAQHAMLYELRALLRIRFGGVLHSCGCMLENSRCPGHELEVLGLRDGELLCFGRFAPRLISC